MIKHFLMCINTHQDGLHSFPTVLFKNRKNLVLSAGRSIAFPTGVPTSTRFTLAQHNFSDFGCGVNYRGQWFLINNLSGLEIITNNDT